MELFSPIIVMLLNLVRISHNVVDVADDFSERGDVLIGKLAKLCVSLDFNSTEACFSESSQHFAYL